MLNKISRILEDTSLSRKDYICALVSIVSKDQKTDKYLKNGIIFKNESNFFDGIGGFVEKDQLIQFNLKEMDYFIRDTMNKYPDLNSDSSKITLVEKLLDSVTILHELEHANQINKRLNSEGLEGKLLRIGHNKIETSLSYEFNPAERLAEIYAYDQIIQISKNMHLPQQIINVFYDIQKENYLRGYQDFGNGIEFPINLYRKAHKMNFVELTLDDFGDSIPSVEYRLKYGLPITKDELEQFKNEITKKSSKENRDSNEER